MPSYFLIFPVGQLVELSGPQRLLGRKPHDPSQPLMLAEWEHQPAVCVGDRIELCDRWVSRTHATLTRLDDGKFSIADAGSRGGTFVNGDQIKESKILCTGDEIQIGQTKIQVTDSAALEEQRKFWDALGSD